MQYEPVFHYKAMNFVFVESTDIYTQENDPLTEGILKSTGLHGLYFGCYFQNHLTNSKCE